MRPDTAQSDDRANTCWRTAYAWFAASPLVLCWISYAVAPAQTFAIPILAIPAAAMLGSRYGDAARWPVAILLAPMLISFGIGPVGFTGTAGIYATALLATRVAGDSRARAAVLNATEPPGPLFLGIMLLAMPWFVASPIFYGTQLSIDLWFLVMSLLLVIGAGQAPLGPIVRWVIGAWLFGLALRVLGLPLSGPFGSIGFNLSSPADLLTALLALYGPRLLRARLPRVQGSTAAGLAVPPLVALFVGALLARLRLAPGMESAFGPIAQVGLVTDATMALIAAGTAMTLPGYWWLAPAAFALARLPMALVLPHGLFTPPIRILGGGLLTALCQIAVIAGSAWVGVLVTRLPRTEGTGPERQSSGHAWQWLSEEFRRGTRVLLVVLLLTVAWLATLNALD